MPYYFVFIFGSKIRFAGATSHQRVHNAMVPNAILYVLADELRTAGLGFSFN